MENTRYKLPYDYEDDNNFIVVDVTAINTNGSLTDEAYYVFSNTTTAGADKKYGIRNHPRRLHGQ